MRAESVVKALVVVAVLLTMGVWTPQAGAEEKKGGPPVDELSNSLSVPAVLIGGSPTLNWPCGSPVQPQGAPLSGYALDPAASYYVQGIHSWQASCATADLAEASAAWGDNLTGDARLKTNSPIRVEMGVLLMNATALGMTGFDVVKLEPNALDRESAYGTQAVQNGGGFTSQPMTPFPEVRVFDAAATMRIYDKDTGIDVLPLGLASAEINATGRIVYGYNLNVTQSGTYVIEFTAPHVLFGATDFGAISADGHTVTLEVVVSPGGSGSKGRQGPK